MQKKKREGTYIKNRNLGAFPERSSWGRKEKQAREFAVGLEEKSSVPGRTLASHWRDAVSAIERGLRLLNRDEGVTWI